MHLSTVMSKLSGVGSGGILVLGSFVRRRQITDIQQAGIHQSLASAITFSRRAGSIRTVPVIVYLLYEMQESTLMSPFAPCAGYTVVNDVRSQSKIDGFSQSLIPNNNRIQSPQHNQPLNRDYVQSGAVSPRQITERLGPLGESGMSVSQNV